VAGLVALAVAGRTLAGARTAGAPPWLALAAALLAAMVLVLPVRWIALALTSPMVNDVTTDPGDPPPLDRARPPVAADGVAPLALDLPAARALVLARETAAAEGWEVTDVADGVPGLVRATASTRWLGFVDDVAIRVRPLDGGRARVDVRSASRVGVGDLGTNARRIRRYLRDLGARAAQEAP
jgi:uncharacterized protein (DUF1499 family)